MRPFALPLAAALLAATTAATLAAPPELAVYVTDENKDVYVALYDDVAIELAGCPSETAARALVALPSAAVEEITLSDLEAGHELIHPKIPCSPDAPFDADFPATTKVWFDLAGTRRYYLSWPSPQGTFYSIPSRCTAIKEAFALRPRIALPGVLQAETAPPQGSIVTEIVLDCGDGAPDPIEPGDGEAAVGDHWSLHQTDVFLSEASVGDTIYVAIHNRVTANGIEKNYLPIYRINGAPSGEAVWEGATRRATVEEALADLFGIDPAEPVTTLGFQDVAKLDTAAYLDLCLTRCDGYHHQNGFFPQPGEAFDLVVLPAPIASQRPGLLGETLLRWEFAQGRTASFVGCDRLTAAMGLMLPGTDSAAWGDAIDRLHADSAAFEMPFVCPPAATEICLRRLAEEGVVSQALFARGSDCPTATRLRVELPKQARISSALVLDATDFADVEIVPRDPIARSHLTASLPLINAVASAACPFEPAPAIIHAKDLSGLRLARIDLVRAVDGPTQELTAMILENARVALDHVTIGSGEGTRPIERTLRLCNAELYVLGGNYQSQLLGLHGLNSRVSLVGAGATDMAVVGAGNFGLFMMSGSTVRMSWAALTAPRAVLLRASDLKGVRVDLAAGGAAPTSSGLRLERGASAAFSVSSARGFACLGVFPDSTATARFTLPTNQLLGDNTRINCGSGAVEIID